MTLARLDEELERDPFVPLRLHLSSGKVVSVPHAGVAWTMSNGLLVLQGRRPGTTRISGYDVINYRLIERIEQVLRGRNGRSRRS